MISIITLHLTSIATKQAMRKMMTTSEDVTKKLMPQEIEMLSTVVTTFSLT